MRPTQRIKVKNGIEYWYEETPYYDPVKKQIRHRSKYLGRNVDGQPVRMRSAPDEVKEKTKKKTVAVKSSYDYGSIFVLQSIIKELNLDRYLGALLPPEDVSMILALAFNRIIRPMTMDNVSSWYEGTSLALESPKISLSRQRIDEQLIRLGKSDIPDRFISQLIKGSETKSAIVYEIAGSSNPPESISFFEHECDPECKPECDFECNFECESLQQVSLSLVLDEDIGLPVMYDIFSESISDVGVLSGSMKKIREHGIEKYVAVMDCRPFFRSYLDGLVTDRVPFVIAAGLQSIDLNESLKKEALNDIDDLKYLHKFNGEPIFARPISCNIGRDEVHGYLYYDPKKEQLKRQGLLIRLHDIRKKLQDMRLNSDDDGSVIFKDIARGFEGFFDWHVIDNHLDAAIKQDAVSQKMGKMGRFTIFCSEDFDEMKCLSLYHERNEIEKSFNTLIGEIRTLPSNMLQLNCQNENTIKGFLFVAFLSLIIRMRLMSMMKSADLLDRYSVEHLLIQLERFRAIVLADGKIIFSEMTKDQRYIFQKLNLRI